MSRDSILYSTEFRRIEKESERENKREKEGLI